MNRTHFFIGDIHGDLAQLKAIVSKLESMGVIASGVIREGFHVNFIGDYGDRGPDSYGVFLYLMSLQAKNPDATTFLLGNHDFMLLQFLPLMQKILQDFARPDLRDYMARYSTESYAYKVGLFDTIKSFPGANDWEKTRNLVNALSTYQALGPWLRGLKTHSVIESHGKRIFAVHAGIPSYVCTPDDLRRNISYVNRSLQLVGIAGMDFSEDTILWDRGLVCRGWAPSQSLTYASRVQDITGCDAVVHGHTRTQGEITNIHNIIYNVDMGLSCFYGQREAKFLMHDAEGFKSVGVTSPI